MRKREREREREREKETVETVNSMTFNKMHIVDGTSKLLLIIFLLLDINNIAKPKINIALKLSFIS